MKRITYIAMLISCLGFVAGCGSAKDSNTASFSDGVVEFENNQCTLGEILENCDDALTKYYDVSDNCNVYEAYIYTEDDGTLLTKYESEFEVVLVDEDLQKQYDITAAGDMKTIYIKQTDKGEDTNDAQLIPWDKMLNMLTVIEYDKIAESGDDYLAVDMIGAMDISDGGMQLTTGDNEKTAVYTIQSKKMVETATDKINGKYYGLTFAGCSNSGGGDVDRTSSMIYNHVVGVLDQK